MNKVCLDTDSLIALFRNNPDAVKRAEKYDSMNAEISTTSINAFKIYFGAFKSRNAAKNVKKADDLFNSIRVLELTLESSKKSAEILSELSRRGIPIDLREALISGIAITSGYSLVTRNVEHSRRVIGLSVESW
jgi:tRNA(fMet)-specific endonuclease VapC